MRFADVIPWQLSGTLAAALAAVTFAAPAAGETILFVGNSFTFGANSAVRTINHELVTDLNREGVGGVPGLFKRFTSQVGLDYQVSLETAPGRSLAWHLANRRSLIDKPWDHVVVQEYSTLDAARPGDPANFVDAATALSRLFAARHRSVRMHLAATWSRPDLVYRPGSRWSGTPIAAMGNDLRLAYDSAARSIGQKARVVPVGQAFTCAIQAGAADANPYDGIDFDKVGLWSWDHYHASSYGYYLKALVVFGSVTGRDPRVLGRNEAAGSELGLSPKEVAALQQAAYQALSTDGACAR